MRIRALIELLESFEKDHPDAQVLVGDEDCQIAIGTVGFDGFDVLITPIDSL